MMDKSKLDFSAAAAAEEDLASLRQLSLAERGRMIKSACQTAMRIEQGKLRSGLPPSLPEPWPESTWAYFKEWTRNARTIA